MSLPTIGIPAGNRGGFWRNRLSRRSMVPTMSIVTPLAGRVRRGPDPVLVFARDDEAPGSDLAPISITNAALRSSMVPRRGAPQVELDRFAHSYDGHAYWSNVDELAEAARQSWEQHGTLPVELHELRGCLFAEQRRWHHLGEAPHGVGAQYLWDLVDAVRDSVTLSPVVLTAQAPAPPRLLPVPPPPPPRAARVVVEFNNDDTGYLAWSSSNQTGYVVNAAKGGSSKSVKIHKAACSSIGLPAGAAAGTRSFTVSYRKVCSPDEAGAVKWCIDNLGTDPDPCQRCKP